MTNAFSKKADNLKAAVALNLPIIILFMINRKLMTAPATEARVDNRVWSIWNLVVLTN